MTTPSHLQPASSPRVLIIAEAANPVLTSAALVAWSCSKALLDKLPHAHLVTELRNRKDILATGLDESRVTFIDTRAIQHSCWQVATWLRRGKDLGWTTYAAFTAIAYPFFERAVWKQFRDRLQQGAYDVVHRVHPLSPMTSSSLAPKLKRLGVPFVIGPLNGGVRWPEPFKYLRAKEKEWMGIFRNVPKWLPGYHRTRRDASALILAARSAWNEMPAQYHEKCVFLPENAIDPDRFPVIARKSRQGPLRVAFVGRLVPLKGVDMLVEAAAPLVKSGKLILDIIGDGPERPALQEQAAQLNCGDGILLDGWVKHEALSGRLAQGHVFAFPSVREFGGGVVLEAMALGLVPIVVDWGGPPELVPQECGFVIPMDTREKIVAALRERLQTLCEDSGSLDSLSENCVRHARGFFTWDAKAEQIVEVYNWVRGLRSHKPHWGMPIAYQAPQEASSMSKFMPVMKPDFVTSPTPRSLAHA
jgi:glycosyltransferase involved in cell wall biosynthesis